MEAPRYFDKIFPRPRIATTQAEVRDHTASLVQDVRRRKEPYAVSVAGVDILVHPGVFPPTTDSRLLAAHIQCSAGTRVLDITTGSGVHATIAGLQGASGVAVDFNPAAVENADANFRRFGVQMRTIQSDMFDNVPPEQFDLIVGNPPPYDGIPTDPLLYGVYGGKTYIAKFFAKAGDFLSPKGRILMTCAEWAGNTDFFESAAQDAGFSASAVASRASEDGKRVYRLYELHQ